MKKYISYFLSMIVLLLCSCKKDINDQPFRGSATFIFDLNNSLKDANADSISAIVLSVEDTSRRSVYTNKQVKLYRMNGTYISAPIHFETGGYKLTEFLVTDRKGNIMFATPVAGSPKAVSVRQPLPISFAIISNNITKVLLEVVSAENSQSKEFGYSSFTFTIINPVIFRINVFVYDTLSGNLTMTDAELQISRGLVEYLKKSIRNGEDMILLPDIDQEYIFNVSKEGYMTWRDTLSRKELLEYSPSMPRKVILMKELKSSLMIRILPERDLTAENKK